MSDFLLGEERILYIKDGLVFKPIGCLTSNPMDETVEVIRTTTRASNGWKTIIPTVQALGISFDGFEIITGSNGDDTKLSYDSLKVKKRLRERIEWKITDENELLLDTGFGYITSIGEANESGSLITFAGFIDVDGEPSFSQVGIGDQWQDGTTMQFQNGDSMRFN